MFQERQREKEAFWIKFHIFYQQLQKQIFENLLEMMDALIGGNLKSSSKSKKSRQSKETLEHKRKIMESTFRKSDLNHNLENLFVELLISDMSKLREKYRFPATIKKAHRHTKAIKYGYNPPIKEGKKKKICPCCQQNINTKNLSILHDHTTIFSNEGMESFRVSSSVAFFFTFIKYLIIMFVIRFAVIDSYNLISNLLNGDYCEGQCTGQFWAIASIFYKTNKTDLIVITDILSFVIVVLLVIYFLIYRKFQYRMHGILDACSQTQDDFSILVENIPILNFPERVDRNEQVQFEYDEDLDKLFSQQIRNWLANGQWDNPSKGTVEYDYQNLVGNTVAPDDIVKSITLCYDISRIDKIKGLRKDIMQKYEKRMADPNAKEDYSGIDEKYDTGPEQVDFLNETEILLCKSYAQDRRVVFNATHFIGTAFISFKYQHYREHIIQKYASNRQAFVLKGQAMRVSVASHPSEIKWKNLRISREARINRICISFGILFLLLVFGFAALVSSDELRRFLIYLVNKKSEDEAKKAAEEGAVNSQGLNIQANSITIITTVVTLVINYLLEFASYSLTNWQRHQNITYEKLSLTVKLVVTQFINTALIYFIISRIHSASNEEMMSQEGLITQISSLIVVSGVIQIFTNLFNFPARLRQIMLWWSYRNKDLDEQIPKFQVNLNRQYERIEFDIAQRYAYYILQLYTVSAYVYLVPVATPAVIVIFFLQYWVDKNNLFNQSSLFYILNYSLSRDILKIAEVSVLIYAVGVVVFSIYTTSHPHQLNVAGLIIASVFVLLSLVLPKRLEKKIFQSYEVLESSTYDECEAEGKFQATYWYRNPATMLVEEGMVTNRQVRKHEVQEEVALSEDTGQYEENT